jgi:hypothetical protein
MFGLRLDGRFEYHLCGRHEGIGSCLMTQLLDQEYLIELLSSL